MMSESSSLNENLSKTLNRMGYATRNIHPYTQAFIESVQKIKKPILDIGAAFGFQSLACLKLGLKVFANDMDKRHLRILQRNVPLEFRSQLKCIAGRFPNEVKFEDRSLGAILASQVLHFLAGGDIEVGVDCFFRWLQPGGKVFVIAGTPYLKAMINYIPLFEKNKEKRDQMARRNHKIIRSLFA